MDKTAEAVEAAKTLLDYAEQLGPTIVGLVALLLAWVTMIRQIRATTVSTSRQRWIDSLQDAMSQFLSATASISTRATAMPLDRNELLRCADEVHSGHARVTILLDSHSKEHRELRNVISKFMEVAMKGGQQTGEALLQTKVAREIVIAAARAAINAEWSKIKRGK